MKLVDVNTGVRVVPLFLELLCVPGDERLAASNLSSLAFLAGSVVPHSAAAVVRVVGLGAVWAGDWVGAGGQAFLPFFLIHVGFLALLARSVVVSFLVITSAPSASDRAVRVNLVSEFPATCALRKSDLSSPPRAETGCVEQEEGGSGEGFELVFIRVGDRE